MAIASYPSATQASAAPAAVPVAPVARRAWSVLAVSTLAFTVCFMVWMMFAVIGIPIRQALNLNATEFGLLTAMPVLTGSLIRVPLGIWTDRYGGRIVMAVLMAVTVPAIWLMAYATAYWHFLVIGLFVGLAGGSFSVGTPYVARWFPKNRQGLAMGIYGAGNSGAAVNKFVAPAILVAFGWTMVPKVYAAVMLGTLENDVATSIAVLDRLPADERANFVDWLSRGNYNFELGTGLPGVPDTSTHGAEIAAKIEEAVGHRFPIRMESIPGPISRLQAHLNLSDGSPLTIDVTPRGIMPIAAWLPYVFVVQMLVIVLCTWFAVRQAIRPLAELAAAGLKITLSMAIWPGLSVSGNAGPATLNPAPVTFAELTVRAAVPIELRMTVWVDAVFSITLPKEMADAFTLSTGPARLTAPSCSEDDFETPSAVAVSVTVCDA